MTMNNFPEADQPTEVKNLEVKVETSTNVKVGTDLVETKTVESVQIETSSDILSVELPLADSHIQIQKTFDFIDDKPVTMTASTASQKADDAQMPSVLVDQQLLDEIAAIPDRFGFKIGDVAALLGVEQYVLRYWEQEFELLKPKKASNNQRLYTKKDVENAFLIRKLVHRDKFAIDGARQILKGVKTAVRKEKDMSSVMQKLDKSNTVIASHVKDLVKDIQRIKELFN